MDNKRKYDDDFIRSTDLRDEDDENLNDQEDSDFEVNANNDFFNNLSSSIKTKKPKIQSRIEEETSNVKQSTLEQKIQKINKKKNKRNKFFNEQNEMKEEQNEESPIIDDIEPPTIKPSNKSEKKEKIDTQQKEETNKKLSKKEEKLISKSQNHENSSTTFQKLNLIKPLLKACDDLGYVKPTTVQQLAIPPILLGRDVLASSMTGSGKTAAFLLPILQRYYKSSLANYSKVLIVIPTRELAMQCHEMLQELNTYTRISSCLIIGAVPIQKQEAELRRFPDIIIATPGRLIDLVKNSQNIDLNDLEIIVFDEADKLLELGFEAEITEIVKNSSPERQTLLFSATLTSDVAKLAKLALKKPIRLEANRDNSTADNLTQEVVKLKNMDENYREACLLLIAKEIYNEKVIIFFKTKRKCHRMAILFGLQNISSCELHGNLSQTQRIQAYHDFKDNKYDFLLATDLAARGLDIKEVKTVINYELPIELKRYIHRVGRTARAGQEGRSLTLCNEFEMKKFKKMVKTCKEKCEKKILEEKKIKKYIRTIDDMEEDFQKILREEGIEKELRKAEMETQKIENMINHREDIYNRPKRTWIQSENDKQRVLKEEKQMLGLEEKEDYKFLESGNDFKRKKLRKK